MSTENKQANVLNPKDLKRIFATWFFTTELSNSYERLQALAFCNAISSGLRKIYKDDEAGFREALQRHLQFYNSEGTFGCVIHGITLSLEEQKAKGVEMPAEVITGLKTGLMGPLAGIGDTIIWGTIKPIILALGCSFALTGNSLGAVIPYIYPIVIVVIGYYLLKLGYHVGKESVMRFMKSGVINDIITGSSILGLFMMGALSSSYVKVSTPLKLTMQNANPIELQAILNQIAPGLLPLCVIFGIYYYFKNKGQNYNKVLLTIILISMVASFLKVLG